MGLARFGNAMYETISTCNETVINISTTEQTITYIPTVEILASEWLTTLCRVYVTILFLSFIWVGIDSYLPKQGIATPSGGGVDVGSLDMAHDDKLHGVGGKR